jgi:uncharacterized protein
LLALAVSWTVAIPLALVAVGILHLPLPFGLHYLAALGPITAALVVSGAGEGRFGLANQLHAVTRWRIGWRWWLVASSPVGLFAAAALLARLVEGSWPDLNRLGAVNFLGDIGAPLALLLWIVTFGFAEETGWRGFALAHLQRRHSLAPATLLVALMWALWHVPYWFYLPGYQDLGITGAPGFFIGLLLGAIVMTWLYNETGGSVAAVAIWHALFDFFSGIKTRRQPICGVSGVS